MLSLVALVMLVATAVGARSTHCCHQSAEPVVWTILRQRRTVFGSLSDVFREDDRELFLSSWDIKESSLSLQGRPKSWHHVTRRSPLEVGLVHALVADGPRSSVSRSAPGGTSGHSHVVLHPRKDQVIAVVAASPTHVTVDTGLHLSSTTVVSHDEPVAITTHSVLPTTHAVVAVQTHPLLSDHPSVTVEHHPALVDHHSVTVAHPAAVTHAAVVVEHHPLDHHVVTPVVVEHPASSGNHHVVVAAATKAHDSVVLVSPHSNLLRAHVGGFGAGIDFGGHGAGHGFYAGSSGFGFRR